MKSGTGVLPWAICLVAVAGVSVCGSTAAAAQCDATAHTVVAVPVYDRPPEFSTANGWVLGQVSATIPAGATIQVCERRRIGFVIGAKTWLHIRDSGGAEGWISAEAIATVRTTSPTLASWFGPTNLYAQTAAAPSAASSGLPGGGRWLWQVWAFFAILVGMAAKTLFDALQGGSALLPRVYLARTVPALLVSPMVFLTLTSLGDGVNFGTNASNAAILGFCAAFQSGFFWQSVLGAIPVVVPKRLSGAQVVPAPRPAAP